MFSKLVDEALVEYLTFETNHFRVENKKTKLKPVRMDEIRKLLGIYLSLHVSCGASIGPNSCVRQTLQIDCMPRNRFKLFRSSTPLTAMTKKDEYARLYKVHPILKHLLDATEMEPYLVVGKIIPFKGRYNLKVCMMKNLKNGLQTVDARW